MIDIDHLALHYTPSEIQYIINQYDDILKMLKPDDALRSIFEHEKGDYECALWVKEYLLDNGKIPLEKIPTPSKRMAKPVYNDISIP